MEPESCANWPAPEPGWAEGRSPSGSNDDGTEAGPDGNWPEAGAWPALKDGWPSESNEAEPEPG